MPAFAYVAVDAEGRESRGMVEADAARQARAGLRNAGLVVISIEPVERPAAQGGRWKLRDAARLSAGQLSLVTRRFAMLLEAGLTVEQCLDALIEQSQDEGERTVLASVREEVRQGHGVAAALERHPGSFPDIYRALIGSGEQSGELAKIVARLADYLESRQQVRRSAGLALLYPAIVACVALLIVIGLLTYVVPQVVDVFQHSRQALPLPTRALLWLSAFLRGNAVYIAGAILLAGLAVRWAYSQEPVRARWHRRVLRIPVVGALVVGADTARLSSTLAILLGSGIPLLRALSAGARVVQCIPLRRAVEQAQQDVREGSTLHRALGKSKLYPPIFIHLIASGEASGRLPHMLSQAARQQELENEARIALLTGLLEPGVIVVVGVVVLLVVLAILLPIIELNRLVKF